jgi:diguanylate cyclase (GGDEF)-like protein
VLLVMDLDHLLAVNSELGHEGGDAWIKAVAEQFAAAFTGEGDLVGRYGGDEFMAVVRGSEINDAARRAEALRARIEKDGPHILVDGKDIQPKKTISIGLAALPDQATEVTELIEKANHALRRCKAAGGNRVQMYEESDWLTGVLNAQASEAALEKAIAQARKNSEALSVFLLDIDRFKEINDEFGHRAGDEVLKRLAHILDTNFKDIGQIGRVAGDEFIVILPGHRADSAFILADEVRRLIDDSEIAFSMGAFNSTLRFHISGGIATFPGDASEPVDLMRKADDALYRSKQIGRNRISLPTSAQMITKTSYYTQYQLERLGVLARELDKTEAFLLREALDDLLRKYREGSN